MQYTFTAYTDSSSATTKNYSINIEIGQTLIDAGFNETYGLTEKWRQLEFFASDLQKVIIIKYKKEFFNETGIEVVIPGNQNEFTVVIDATFEFWDNALGVPLLRKFITNVIMEDNHLGKPFDEDQLLGLA